MDELLTEFLNETNENLSGLDRQMVELERNPEDSEIIRSIFRVIHTIKGTCGFLGLNRLESVAHASENVLGRMRDGTLQVNPTVMGTLFAAVDRLKAIVSAIEQGEEERNPHEDTVVINALSACLNATSEEEIASHVEKAVSQAIASAPSNEEEASFHETQSQEQEITHVEEQTAHKESEVIEPSKPLQHEPPLPPSTTPIIKKEEPNSSATPATPTPQFIRVNLDILDNLIALISELVLTRNQLLQLMQSSQDTRFHASLSRLSYITSELQEEVMKTRMQSIENAWSKFPRLIRDLTRDLNKKIDLVQIGGDTELDRQVLELIKDPLTHMIRNSCDHGLEDPQTRLASGKKEVGTITLKAYHEGGQIIIEIEDDGRGIDPDKLRKKLVEKRIVSEEEIQSMSDWQIINFIFKPGFSTAEAVTNVSGRGVGMDVVKSNIEKLGGIIDLQSTLGKGTRFVIKIPLTLTIISAIILESAGERFAIPQISVTELVRVSKRSPYGIEYINKTPVLRLRKGLLPLVFLSELLNIDSVEKNSDSERCVIVTHIGNTGFGIVVDRVYDTQEIVVKPLSKIIRNVRYFSGSTILGDGGIVMILDPNSIAYQINKAGGDGNASSASTSVRNINDKTLLLVFRVKDTVHAVPLALVARIAELSYSQMENINNTWLTRYQDHLLPVAKFEGDWDVSEVTSNPKNSFPLLIFTDRGHAMGLAIDEIVNIVEESLDIEIHNRKAGSLGTSIIAGKTTSIVDCEYYLKKAYPDWFEHQSLSKQVGSRKINMLLVDDSQFFRNLLLPVLTLAGFEVTTATSAEQGLEYCKEFDNFDIIISDIEMPGLSGFDFVRNLRAIETYKHKTVIALTSRASPEDIQFGIQCGFNYHYAKTQQKQLVDALEVIRENILSQEALQ